MTLEQVDLAIVGAGPAGLTAGVEVSRHGGRVVILEEGPVPGGRLRSQIHPQRRWSFGQGYKWSNGAYKAKYLAKAAIEAGVKIVCGASVWTISPGWFVGVTPTDSTMPGKTFPTGFETRSVLIATGAVQNPLPISGWTLPGVITAGAAQTLINVNRVLPGRHVVIIGIDPLSIAVARLMTAVGIDVKGVLLPPANNLHSGPSTPRQALHALSQICREAPTFGFRILGILSDGMGGLAAQLFSKNGIKIDGFPLMLRRTILGIEGAEKAEQVRIAALRANGTVVSTSEESWTVDAVVTSAGLHPLIELTQVAGCPLSHISALGGWVPVHSRNMETPVSGLFVAGSVTGVENARVAEAQGETAGTSISGYLRLLKGSVLKKKLVKQKLAIERARRESFPFLAGTKAGRMEMSRSWRKHAARAD